MAPGTINKEIGLLSSAFNWARKELGWDIVNPVAGRRLSEGQGRLRWLTRAEATALLRAAENQRRARHLADFIRLSLHTGMRKGEVLGLEWRRVDLSQGLIYLEAEHQKNGKFGCAAWLVQAGVPIREVAELLRHADIRMTMRYAHLAPENVRAAVARLAPAWSRFGHVATAFPDR